MRTFVVILALVTLCGCRSATSSGYGLRADDKRLSPQERRVISAARSFLEQRFQKPVDGYYTIKETTAGYVVIVSFPSDYEHGHPRFTPDSSVIVELRKDLTVERYLPEY